jgi:hypothetical protein
LTTLAVEIVWRTKAFERQSLAMRNGNGASHRYREKGGIWQVVIMTDLVEMAASSLFPLTIRERSFIAVFRAGQNYDFLHPSKENQGGACLQKDQIQFCCCGRFSPPNSASLRSIRKVDKTVVHISSMILGGNDRKGAPGIEGMWRRNAEGRV